MKGEMISIIVPIYKVEPYLERCIDSLINQTYENLEIILVDDGSPDKCPILCDNYVKKDSRVKVIHKKNGGLSDARNAGLQMATGKYVMYVDSDDYIEEDSCEKLIERMAEDVDIVVGACKEITPSGVKYQQHTNLEEKKVYMAKEYVCLSIAKNEWYAPAVLNMYCRQFLIEHNLYYKKGYYFEDMEMLPRLFLANPKVCYVNYPFYNYIIRPDSIMTSNITEQKIKMALDIYEAWYKLFESLSDIEYRNELYGALIKHYVATARRMKIKEWKIEGLDFPFAIKYARNFKEKFKVVFFNYFPSLYIKI